MVPERLKSIKAELWPAFVDRCYRSLFNFAWAMLADRQEAEDVVQETFLKAYQHLEITDNNWESGETRAWLYATARNLCLDKYRRWKRWLGVLRALKSSPSASGSNDPAGFLLKAIQRLPMRQRQVLVLRQWHGFSIEETAKILKIGEGSVKSHLSRAVEAVKQQLEGEGRGK